MGQGVDPYAVLQVVPTADPEVIRAAYRALARRFHPDRSTNADDARRMVELNAAWELLGDPARRAQYDLMVARGTTAGGNARRRKPQTEGPTEDVRPGEGGWGSDARQSRTPTAPPPAGPASGSVLDFGRYCGWSLGQIARFDPDYLEWFKRTPLGRRFGPEIDRFLQPVAARSARREPPIAVPRRRTWMRPRR